MLVTLALCSRYRYMQCQIGEPSTHAVALVPIQNVWTTEIINVDPRVIQFPSLLSTFNVITDENHTYNGAWANDAWASFSSQNLDLLLHIQISFFSDVLVGYSHLHQRQLFSRGSQICTIDNSEDSAHATYLNIWVFSFTVASCMCSDLVLARNLLRNIYTY